MKLSSHDPSSSRSRLESLNLIRMEVEKLWGRPPLFEFFICRISRFTNLKLSSGFCRLTWHFFENIDQVWWWSGFSPSSPGAFNVHLQSVPPPPRDLFIKSPADLHSTKMESIFFFLPNCTFKYVFPFVSLESVECRRFSLVSWDLGGLSFCNK